MKCSIDGCDNEVKEDTFLSTGVQTTKFEYEGHQIEVRVKACVCGFETCKPVCEYHTELFTDTVHRLILDRLERQELFESQEGGE